MEESSPKKLSLALEDPPPELIGLMNSSHQAARDVENDEDVLERETRCGLGPLRPAWLQRLASKKAFVLVYGLIGTTQFALASYFVATISTMEKRFKIPSKTSGLINSAWDIGSVSSSLFVAYLGRSSHKTRWVAWGTTLVSLSCFLRLLPHWLYGPGEDALALTTEYGDASTFRRIINETNDETSPSMSLCGNNHTETEDCSSAFSGHVSAGILFFAHCVLGVGTSVYYTLGISYMDDNARKNKAPIMLAIWQCLRMLGPTVGYLLASYTLNMFVAPDLTPTIDSNDPRWVGAWWYGWTPFGIATIILAVIMSMFPRSLPRAVQRSVAAAAAQGTTYEPHKAARKSLADFKSTLLRLMKNKILICNCISSVCFMFGMIGQWVFMPKYMETQFHQSASTASLISGSVGVLCSAAGVLVSSAVISRFKPGSRKLAGWNVFVEFCDVIGFITITFIGCEAFNLQGNPQPDGTLGLNVDCNAECGCAESLRYTPVCDPRSKTTFFSGCHAGCASADWISLNSSAKSFSNCSCVEGGGPVTDGPCPVNCNQAFLFYILVQCIQRFLSATGKAGNTLIHFRCVSPEDKPVALGLSEVLLCGCSFIPGPIFFGYLIDMSCLVWGMTCGKTGNCLLYDVDKLRLYVNAPIVVCLFIGTLWDIGVWYLVKGLELYDTNEENGKKGSTPPPLDSTDMRRDSRTAALSLAATGDIPSPLSAGEMRRKSYSS